MNRLLARTMARTLLLLIALAAPAAMAQSEKEPMKNEESAKLNRLIDDEWAWGLQEFPTGATSLGEPGYNDRWPDLAASAYERRRKHAHDVLARLKAIDRSKLPKDDQLNYDLFRRDVELDIAGQRFPEELMPINQMGGLHQDVADLMLYSPHEKVKDFDDTLKRLRSFPLLLDQTIDLMRRGLAKGLTPPRITLRNVREAIDSQIVDDPTRSPIYEQAFGKFPESVSKSEQDRIRSEAQAAIRESVVPAYRKLAKFWNEEYEPRARTTVGASNLPDGKAWYEWRIRQMTTTDLTADQIHEIGLHEVKRIRAEMEKIKDQTGFKGDLAAFFTFLRTDPQFYFHSKDALITAYRDIAKRIDPELPRLFGTLPRLTYGVLPVPAYSEKNQTTAYYSPGSVEAGRPGYFFANTYDLKSRPKWEMEALTVHEAVPGHHLQISRAQELGELPKFRRNAGYTAFVEGWGLYSESLGPELGLYKDPYSKFGQLTYEMWRAIRLVVDTGIHSKGWTREQAISFFKDNAGKTEHDITVEIDRYIVLPAQALAYKLGELKIKELRAYATQELGDRFDIRRFHDVVLGAGSLPLSILETRVKDWVAEMKTKKAA